MHPAMSAQVPRFDWNSAMHFLLQKEYVVPAVGCDKLRAHGHTDSCLTRCAIQSQGAEHGHFVMRLLCIGKACLAHQWN